MSNYSNLAKKELLKVIEKLESELEEQQPKVKDYDNLLKIIKNLELELEGQKLKVKDYDNLLKVIKNLESELEEQKLKVKDYDKLQQKYQITVDARKEDREKVVGAEKNIALIQAKEQEMSQYYGQQIGHMKKTLDEQNETIVSLFDMMDNTINLQLNYYQKYKNIFISIEKMEEQ